MPKDKTPGRPTTRRYSDEEKAQAVRLKRVAEQLGYGTESVRAWVRQADVDGGLKAGRSAEDAELIRELQQRNRELERANKILRKASAYFAQAELDRP